MFDWNSSIFNDRKTIETKSKDAAKSFFKSLYGGRGSPRKVEPVIISYLQNRPEVIYGSYAVMQQIPKRFRRQPNDIDIKSLNPRTFIHKLESTLEDLTLNDTFDIEKLPVRGEDFNVFRIVRKRDGDVLVDVSLPKDEKLPEHIVIDQVRYETLKSIYESKFEDVQDPEKTYRKKKDVQDLRRIERAIKSSPTLQRKYWKLLRR